MNAHNGQRKPNLRRPITSHVTQGHEQCHFWTDRIRLPLLFRIATVLYRFRNIARYVRKQLFLSTSRVFGTLVEGDPAANFTEVFWLEKTAEVIALSNSVKDAVRGSFVAHQFVEQVTV